MENVWFNCNRNNWEEGAIDYFKKNGKWNKVIQSFGLPKKQFPEYSSIPPAIYKEIYPELYKFIDMFSRNNKHNQNSYNQLSVHEHLNLFNLLINYYFYEFTLNKIDLIIFNRAPHVGFDFISYLVANKMGIKTLFLEQSLFPNRFYYYWDHYDYGSFETSDKRFTHKFIKVENKFEKDLFYMKNIKNEPSLFSIRNLKDLYNYSPKVKLLRELMDKELRGQALYRYQLNEEFEINRRNEPDIYENIDMEIPFIYFGLHLQPEKTTSSWGDIYTDQLLAIEHLSSILPKNWKIYVKENPKQGYFMRGKYFYKRLKNIPNTVLVPNGLNTYTLLANCKIAATITGTLGWEAISGGKPVIIFGWGAWYKRFEGVFTFNFDLDLLECSQYTFSKENIIEEQLNKLLDKTGEGVVYDKGGYVSLVSDYNKEDNTKNIINSLDRIIYDR